MAGRHADNVDPHDQELMHNMEGEPYSCYVCARKLHYGELTYMVPTFTEVGVVAELVGICCVKTVKTTWAALKKEMQR